MKKLKKLVLKKEVITQLNNKEMNELNGGLFDTRVVCITIYAKTCHTQNSCTELACIPL